MPSLAQLVALASAATLALASTTPTSSHARRDLKQARHFGRRSGAAVIERGWGKRRLSTRAFAALDYADAQISDGTAGNCLAAAEAVCVQPFAGTDLAAVSQDDLSNLATFRSAAEAAETDFNTGLESLAGEEADTLQRGKICNKVLKLSCLAQVNIIKQAQGDTSAAAKIADSQKKLANNVAQDVAAAGLPMKGVTGGAAPAVVVEQEEAAVVVEEEAATEEEEEAAVVVEEEAAVETEAVVATGALFPPLVYEDVEISTGTAGDAKAAAEAVCVAPFAGVDLATVSADDLDNLKTFREAAESAETDQFNPAIEAATGAEADALDAGKTANKVLKLTCELQADQIEAAQGKDKAAAIADHSAKLANNIAKDEANAGQEMKSFLNVAARRMRVRRARRSVRWV